MGVLGLPKFMERHSKKFFKDISLNGTSVVIDGSGLLWYIFDEVHGADPKTHGGEYVLFRSKILYFFQNLMKCNCSPYVVFDGSFDLDDKKHNTHLERYKSRIKNARNVLKGKNRKLMPPLAKCLMKLVMTEIGVQFACSQFEADREIAVLANQLDCPVIGKDSDFYVMDIAKGYIPFTYLKWKRPDFRKGKYCIAGRVYEVEEFCISNNMNKELLPLFASLAGNDYIKPSYVKPFVLSVCASSKKQDQLKELLEWLSEQMPHDEKWLSEQMPHDEKWLSEQMPHDEKWLSEQMTCDEVFEKVLMEIPDREEVRDQLSSSVASKQMTYEEAFETVLRKIPDREEVKDQLSSSVASKQMTYEEAFEKGLREIPARKKVKDQLSSSVAMYRTDCGSGDLKSYFEECSSQVDLYELCTKGGAPCWVAEAQRAGALASTCINILCHGYCFSPVQVENLEEESAWMPSKFLFAVLCGIILADKEDRGDCSVYIRDGIVYQEMTVTPLTDIPIFGELPSLKDIPSLSENDKQRLLTGVLVPSLCQAPEQYRCFPADFQLALLGTVHCLNSTETKMTQYHLASLLTGWVYLYAQRPQERRGKTSDEKSDSQKQVDVESRVVEQNLRHHQGRLRKRKPDAIVSHGFAQWQQCMLYAIYLNEILQYPLPRHLPGPQPSHRPRPPPLSPDVSILYNGLFMHSLYATFPDVWGREELQRWIGSRFFRAAPKAFTLFQSMHNFVLNLISDKAQEKLEANKRSSSTASSLSHQSSDTSASRTSTGDTFLTPNRFAALKDECLD